MIGERQVSGAGVADCLWPSSDAQPSPLNIHYAYIADVQGAHSTARNAVLADVRASRVADHLCDRKRLTDASLQRTRDDGSGERWRLTVTSTLKLNRARPRTIRRARDAVARQGTHAGRWRELR